MVLRQDAVRHVLIDVEPERPRNDARNPRTPETEDLRVLSSTMARMSASLGPFGPGFFGRGLDENKRRYLRRTNAWWHCRSVDGRTSFRTRRFGDRRLTRCTSGLGTPCPPTWQPARPMPAGRERKSTARRRARRVHTMRPPDYRPPRCLFPGTDTACAWWRCSGNTGQRGRRGRRARVSPQRRRL